MIDTLRLNIPLSRGQWQKIVKATAEDPNWQWIQFQASTGEMRRIQVKGSAQMDEGSYNRDICWFLPPIYREGETSLTVEFSLPKLWYGHNISLLYDYLKPLNLFKQTIEKKFNIRLPKVMTWGISRLDVCYAYQCPTQGIAQALLDSLKHLHFPRKKPIIRPESIFFGGATYSLKFYLKQPEFRAHDMKEMMKRGYSLDYINHLEQKAAGVLRTEAKLTRKYLKRMGIDTVEDLAKLMWHVTLVTSESTVTKHIPERDFDISRIFEKLGAVSNGEIGIETVDGSGEMELNMFPVLGEVEDDKPLIDRRTGDITINSRQSGILTHILSIFLEKFIGIYKMDDITAIKQKLTETFKPHKAARLLHFWMHVQKFGTSDAKKMIGEDSYYRSKRELKKLGISLVEPPKVIDARDRFLKSFTFTVPSEHAVNLVDDDRNMTNLLNLLPRSIEQ